VTLQTLPSGLVADWMAQDGEARLPVAPFSACGSAARGFRRAAARFSKVEARDRVHVFATGRS